MAVIVGSGKCESYRGLSNRAKLQVNTSKRNNWPIGK